MEQPRELQNSSKKGTSPNQDESKSSRRRVVVRERQPVLSGSDVTEVSLNGRVSQTPQGWSSLGLGEAFSRSPDGSFVHVKVSCSKAYALDSANPLKMTPEQQMSTRVYRVWLNTF